MDRLHIKKIKEILKNIDTMTIEDIDHECWYYIISCYNDSKSKKLRKYCIKLASAAINRNSDYAMYLMGYLYEEVSIDKAITWYEEALKKGNVNAMVSLADMYMLGRKVEKNLEKANSLYTMAIEIANPTMLMNIVRVYEDKMSPMYDEEKSLQIYKKAALKGYERAIIRMIIYYHHRVFDSVELNDLDKCSDGMKYSFDLEIKKGLKEKLDEEKQKIDSANQDDLKELFYWTNVGCDFNNKDALFYMGYYYLKEIGCSVDEVKAFEYYKRAAERNCYHAYFGLASAYFYGIGTEKNHHDALEWYLKCSENPIVLEKLGDIYYLDEGVTPDYKKAFTYYWRAAELENCNAEYKIANCYQEGKGCEVNYDKAKEWYQRAASHGNEDAKNKLYMDGHDIIV